MNSFSITPMFLESDYTKGESILKNKEVQLSVDDNGVLNDTDNSSIVCNGKMVIKDIDINGHPKLQEEKTVCESTLTSQSYLDKSNRIFSCSQSSYTSETTSNVKPYTLNHIREKCSCKSCRKNEKLAKSGNKEIEGSLGVKRSYACNQCSHISDNISGLKRHMVIHIRDECKCQDCQEEGNLLKPNNIEMAFGMQRRYRCYQCSYICMHNRSLIRHMKEKHMDNSTNSLEMEEFRNFIPSKKLYTCIHCSFQCKCKKRFQSHQTLHQNKKVYSCDLCSFRTAHKTSIIVHNRRHLGVKLYTCSYCSYKCEENGTLKKHMLIHSDEKPYSCNQCSFRTTFRSTLRVHKRYHEIELPYCCKMCKYRAASSHALTCHMRTHTGEKPFRCVHCSFRTASKQSLIVHLKTHEQERPFACPHCSSTFIQKILLNKHMRNHFSYIHCEFTAATKNALNDHIKTHISENSNPDVRQ